jgi:class 3 adenylate cyclase/ABC-type cobalamin/Fe3+-siderophores transport system ATPase subunit
MADLHTWLNQRGLGGLAQVLSENDIDVDILPDLTDQDLERLGLSLGQRRRLLKVIATVDDNAAKLSSRPSTSAPISSDAEPPLEPREAERRQVTVMFCDLVDSTKMSGELDPEDMNAIIRVYQDTCGGCIARFDGFLAKLMGDGVLAYFGFPHAHEDSAERAVRAALAIVQAVSQLSAPGGRGLHVRIGMASGLVVVGDIVGTGVAREQAIVGETANLAARVQVLAAVDTVCVSHSTYRLIGRIFEVEDRGEHMLKGFAQPQAIWRIRSEASVESRFAAVRSVAKVPFIGRDHEIGLLLDRWNMALSREGQFILVTGEAGIGKSRLIEALRERVGTIESTVLLLQCSPHQVNTTLYPLVSSLEVAAEFAAGDLPEQKLEKLERFLKRTGDKDNAALPFYADVMSLPTVGAASLPKGMSPGQRRAATIAAVVERVLRLSERHPVLFLLEDAHWIDPTSLELMTQTIDAITVARVLIVVTARPDFASPWAGRGHSTHIALSRLGRAHSAEMIGAIVTNYVLPAEVIDEIVNKTDGVPLFVEELTKSILEAGVASLGAIPATLQDSLMARLDRLEGAKDIAQVAAVIGREFSRGLLGAVTGANETRLDQAIDRLIKSEIVFPQGKDVEVSYRFKHALIRDAAYGSLLRSRRQRLHGQIGKALEELFSRVADDEPELLAYHFERAGQAEPAARYHELSGDRAAARFAYKEAIAHYTLAAEQFRTLPDHAAPELRALLKLAPAMAIIHGNRSQEHEDISRAAYEIAQTIHDGRERFAATWNMWFADNVRVRTARALSKAEELVSLGHRLRDDDLILEGIHCRWSTGLFGGAYSGTYVDSGEGIKRYDPARHHKLGIEFGGHDPGVCAHSCHSIVLAVAGSRDTARDTVTAAIALGDQLAHPPSLAHALIVSMITCQVLGDLGATERTANRAIETGEKYKMPPPLALGRFYLAWARAMATGAAADLDFLEAALEQAKKFGPMPTIYASMVAQAQIRSGEFGKGLDLIDRILAGLKGPEVGSYCIPKLLSWRVECLVSLPKGSVREVTGPPESVMQLAQHHHDQLAALKAAIAAAKHG